MRWYYIVETSMIETDTDRRVADMIELNRVRMRMMCNEHDSNERNSTQLLILGFVLVLAFVVVGDENRDSNCYQFSILVSVLV